MSIRFTDNQIGFWPGGLMPQVDQLPEKRSNKPT